MTGAPKNPIKRQRRETFREYVERTRWQAAMRTWGRARLMSQLRHLAVSQSKHLSAKLCGEAKLKAICRSAELAPELVELGVDTDYRIGTPSVRCRGRGRLHIPKRACRLLAPWFAHPDSDRLGAA